MATRFPEKEEGLGLAWVMHALQIDYKGVILDTKIPFGVNT